MKKLFRRVGKRITRRLLDYLSLELARCDDTTIRRVGRKINQWVDIPGIDENAEARIIYRALRKAIATVEMLLNELD